MILAWQVISRTLASYLADFAPEDALVVNGSEPLALVNLADEQLNALIPPQPAVPAGQFAKDALLQDPLNARALRILGQLADYAKDDMRAKSLMALAARYSLRESVATAWMAHESYETKDYPRAIYYSDVLLRTRPNFAASVMPLFGHLAETKEASGELKRLLRTNPPWRPYFFATLPNSVTDARTPLDILLSVRDSANPPSNAELRPYLLALMSHKLYDLAYYTWLQFLPPEELGSAGLLFNGSFDVVPSGLPFDWVITQGSGVTIDMVRMPEQDHGRALFIDFQYGRVEYHSVTQMIMLAPANYQFTAKYKGELIGPRGLKWRIICGGATATLLGESQMIIGKADGWKEISFNFTVPQGNCRPQIVSLDLDARMASEQLITGPVWFENMQIARSE